MKLDLKSFKKLKSDRTHTEMEHPDGHVIRIAHKALSPEELKHMRAIPLSKGGTVPQPQTPAPAPKPMPISKEQADKFAKGAGWYANGGEVADTAQSQGEPFPEDSAAYKAGELVHDIGSEAKSVIGGLAEKFHNINPLEAGAQALSRFGSGLMGADAHTPAPQEPAQATPTPTPENVNLGQPKANGQGSGDPFGTQAYESSFTKGLQTAMQGQQEGAQAAQTMGQEQAAVAHATAMQQERMTSHYQQQLSDLNAEHQAFVQDVQDKHIDPNRFMNSMGTGQRISTILGILVSGLGGAPNNAALDLLHKQIDRDIDSQKAELGKSENLLSANMKQFGNLRDAVDMTKAMQLGAMESRLKEAAAKAQGPAAKAAADQAIGKLQMDSAGLMSQIAARKALLGGNGTQAQPAAMVRVVVPEAHQKAALDEIKSQENLNHVNKNALNSFDAISKINTFTNRALNPLQSAAQIDAEWGPMIDKVTKESTGRVVPITIELMAGLKPTPWDSPATIAIKRQKFDALLNSERSTPTLDQYGIKVSKDVGAAAPNMNTPSNYPKAK